MNPKKGSRNCIKLPTKSPDKMLRFITIPARPLCLSRTSIGPRKELIAQKYPFVSPNRITFNNLNQSEPKSHSGGDFIAIKIKVTKNSILVKSEN